MSEFYFQAPTPEQVTATYKGMTFEEIQVLDDTAIQELLDQERQEWFEACEEHNLKDDAWLQARDKVATLSRFVKWRTFGVPDRDMFADEFLERMHYYATTRLDKDPSYGQLDPADLAHLSEDEMELTDWVFQDAWNDGIQMQGQPTVEVGGNIGYVSYRLGVTLDDLVEKGILETYAVPPSVLFKESTGYVLTGKIAMHLFALRYSETDIPTE